MQKMSLGEESIGRLPKSIALKSRVLIKLPLGTSVSVDWEANPRVMWTIFPLSRHISRARFLGNLLQQIPCPACPVFMDDHCRQ